MTAYYVYYAFAGALYFLMKRLDGRKKAESRPAQEGKRRFRLSWKKRYALIVFALLILLLGLRSREMGNDLPVYLSAFIRFNWISWKRIFIVTYANFERGFIVFNKLVGSIYTHRQFFLFCSALASIAPIGILVADNSKNPLESLYIYLSLPVFLSTFSALRQAISIGIVAISFIFVKRKKLIPFLLTILLALFFHKSSLVFLLAYPTYHSHLSKRQGIWITLILPIAWLFRYQLFALGSFYQPGVVPDNNGSIHLFIIFSLIYLFCSVLGDRSDPVINGTANLFFIACFFQSVGSVYGAYTRIGYYFTIFLPILLPNVLGNLSVPKFLQDRNILVKDSHKKILEIVIICIFIVSGLVKIRTTYWSECYPYTFFWQQQY